MDVKRRAVNYSLVALAGGGVYFNTKAIFSSLEPPKKAMLQNATFIDTTSLPINQISLFSWQKKPIFILKKESSFLSDSQREFKIGEFSYIVMLGICTHLGCVPKVEPDKLWCPCHNGEFDLLGNPQKSPVTKALPIPPFKIQDNFIVIGEIGEEYLRLKENA